MRYIVIALLIANVVSLKNLCVNCKHFKGSFFGNQYGTCSKFAEVKEKNNPYVDGSAPIKTLEYTYCSIARKYDHLCGNEGKSFEKK